MQPDDDRAIIILIAEDDPDHQLLVRAALRQARLANEVEFVNDGQEALDYLRKEGEYADNSQPPPDLILLDLNMPRKSGIDVLSEIKVNPRFRSIPVVILTTSDAPDDIATTYDLGANSFITKPISFERLVEVTNKLTDYWFKIVRLPPS